MHFGRNILKDTLRSVLFLSHTPEKSSIWQNRLSSSTVNSSVSIEGVPLSHESKFQEEAGKFLHLEYRTVIADVPIGSNKTVLLQHQTIPLPQLGTSWTPWKDQTIQVNSSRNATERKKKKNQTTTTAILFFYYFRGKNGGMHIYAKRGAKQLQKMVRKGGWSTWKKE